MTNINWKSEALEFAKAHDMGRAASVAVIEKAMQHGAFLMVEKSTALIKKARTDLEKKRIASVPHKHQTKIIALKIYK